MTAQYLTPEELCWVLDIGASTEAAWRRRRPPVIAYFKVGRLIRYAPKDVAAGIAARTVKARPIDTTLLDQPDFWERLQRLVNQSS